MYLVVPTSTLRSQSIGLMNIGRLGAVHTTHAPAQSTNSPPIQKPKWASSRPYTRKAYSAFAQAWLACSEALPMHDGRARLVVLRLGDPHLLEGTQRGEDGPANPHRVLTLRGRHHLDLHRRRRQSRQLFRHALADAQEHRGATREHHVGVEVLANVHVALHDGLECGVVDTARLLADEAGLEEHLGASEALVAHSDDVTVWEFVGLLFVRAVCSLLHLGVEVQGDVAQFFLHVA